MLQGFATDDAFLILAKGIFRTAQGDGRQRTRKSATKRERERERERGTGGWQFPVITANPYFIA